MVVVVLLAECGGVAAAGVGGQRKAGSGRDGLGAAAAAGAAVAAAAMAAGVGGLRALRARRGARARRVRAFALVEPHTEGRAFIRALHSAPGCGGAGGRALVAAARGPPETIWPSRRVDLQLIAHRTAGNAAFYDRAGLDFCEGHGDGQFVYEPVGAFGVRMARAAEVVERAGAWVVPAPSAESMEWYEASAKVPGPVMQQMAAILDCRRGVVGQADEDLLEEVGATHAAVVVLLGEEIEGDLQEELARLRASLLEQNACWSSRMQGAAEGAAEEGAGVSGHAVQGMGAVQQPATTVAMELEEAARTPAGAAPASLSRLDGDGGAAARHPVRSGEGNADPSGSSAGMVYEVRDEYHGQVWTVSLDRLRPAWRRTARGVAPAGHGAGSGLMAWASAVDANEGRRGQAPADLRAVQGGQVEVLQVLGGFEGSWMEAKAVSVADGGVLVRYGVFADKTGGALTEWVPHDRVRSRPPPDRVRPDWSQGVSPGDELEARWEDGWWSVRLERAWEGERSGPGGSAGGVASSPHGGVASPRSEEDSDSDSSLPGEATDGPASEWGDGGPGVEGMGGSVGSPWWQRAEGGAQAAQVEATRAAARRAGGAGPSSLVGPEEATAGLRGGVRRRGASSALRGAAEEVPRGVVAPPEDTDDSDDDLQPGMITDDSGSELSGHESESGDAEEGVIPQRQRVEERAQAVQAEAAQAAARRAGVIETPRPASSLASALKRRGDDRDVMAKVQRRVGPAVARARARREGDSAWKAARRAGLGSGCEVSSDQGSAPPVTLLTWNVSSMQARRGGGAEGGGLEADARRRPEVLAWLAEQMQATDVPPTFVTLNEIQGTAVDMVFLRLWFRARGYEAVVMPGQHRSEAAKRPGKAPTGGVLLAWHKAQARLVPGTIERVVMPGLLRGVFRVFADASTMGVASAYGSDPGRLIQGVQGLAVRAGGGVVAGDFNMVPCESYRQGCQVLRSRADVAMQELVGKADDDAEGGEAPPLARLVDLGLNHAAGEFTRTSWSTGQGTATIDHVLELGEERGLWSVLAVIDPIAGQRRLSDHACIVVRRRSRLAGFAQAQRRRVRRNISARLATDRLRLRYAEYCAAGLGELVAGRHAPARLLADTGLQGEEGLGVRPSVRVRQFVEVLMAADLRLEKEMDNAAMARAASGVRRAADLSEAAVVAEWRRCKGSLKRLRQGLATGRLDSAVVGHLNASARAGVLEAKERLGTEAAGARAEAELRKQAAFFAARAKRHERKDDDALRAMAADARRLHPADVARRRDAVLRMMRPRTVSAKLDACLRGDDGSPAGPAGDPAEVLLQEPEQVLRELPNIHRRIDDENLGGGANMEAAEGWFRTFVPRFEEVSWSIKDVTFAEWEASLNSLGTSKAPGLDEVTKEHLQMAPREMREQLYRALAEAASPDGTGEFDTPLEWRELLVIYLPKKSESMRIAKKRDITLTSQVQKLLCAAVEKAYERPSYNRILPTNAGWVAGDGAQDAAAPVGACINQAHTLKHDLFIVFADQRRFFPSMDRDVILLASAWAGVPKDVRDLADKLYREAVVRIDTAHGLTDAVPGVSSLKSGSPQGCRFSTLKARILMASLAEAVNILSEGVSLWNGSDGCVCEQAEFGDDVTLPCSSLPAAVRLTEILGAWAWAVNSALGIDGYSKLCIAGVTFDEKGRARDVAESGGLVGHSVGPASPLVRLRDGRSVPFVPMNVAYAQVGFRWRLDGSQKAQIGHLAKLIAAWLARVARVRNITEDEFAELTNLGFSGLIGFYASLLPVTDEVAERIAEVPRRRLFEMLFNYPRGTPRVDRYLRHPLSSHAYTAHEIEEGVQAASLRGSGWKHAAALAAAAMHAYYTSVIADPRRTRSRDAVRSMVALTAYVWGCRCRIDEWDYRHLCSAMAKPARGTGRVSMVELWLVRLDAVRAAAGLESRVVQLVGDVESGDPFDPEAPTARPETQDGLLLTSAGCEPSFWLLSAGFVVRSQVCTEDGTGFMLFPEARRWQPLLARGGAQAARDWDRMRAVLVRGGVVPLPRENVRAAEDVWKRERAKRGEPAGAMGPELTGAIERAVGGDKSVTAAGWHALWAEWAVAMTRGGYKGPRPAEEHVGQLATLPERQGAGERVRCVMPGTTHACASPEPSEDSHWFGWTLEQATGIPVHDTLEASKARSAVVRLFWQASQYLEAAVVAAEADPTGRAKPPKFNLAVSRLQFEHLIARERQEGGFDVAVAGDGARTLAAVPDEDLLGRAALSSEGDVFGGRMLATSRRFGRVDNYEAELDARLDFLAVCKERGWMRVLYAFDATSPIEASLAMRRRHVRARMHAIADEQLAVVMALEDELDSVTYMWQKSHVGSILETVVDLMAGNFAESGAPPKPSAMVRAPRHRSARFGARGSERELMLEATGVLVAQRMLDSSVDTLRPSAGQTEVLCSPGLHGDDRATIAKARGDRLPLMDSKAFVDSGPDSLGAAMRRAPCPCGVGTQSREHVLLFCMHGAEAREVIRRSMAVVNQKMATTGVHTQYIRCMSCLASPASATGASRKEAVRCLLGMVDSSGGDGSALLALQGGVLRKVAALLRKAVAGAVEARARVTDGVNRRTAVRALFRGMRAQALAAGPFRFGTAAARMRMEERVGGPPGVPGRRMDQGEAAAEPQLRRWRLDHLPAQGEKARAELWMARRTAATVRAVDKTWRMAERVFRWWLRTREAARIQAEVMAAAGIAPEEGVNSLEVEDRGRMEAASEALANVELGRLVGLRAVAAAACDRVQRCMRGLRAAWAAKARDRWRGKYPPAGPRPARPEPAAVSGALRALGLAELPGSGEQVRAAAAALVLQALGAEEGEDRWIRRWVREVTGARAVLAAESAVRPPTAQDRAQARALQVSEEAARRTRGLRRQESERARDEAARAAAGESYGVPLGGVPLPPRPAWALAETESEGPIVVLGAAERMETATLVAEPTTVRRTRRREAVEEEVAARRVRVMRNSSRRAEAIANAADAAVGDGEFSQGQQLNAIHVRQDNRRQEEARKRARGSAGETLGDELRALGEGLRRALAGAQGGEHANERGGKFVRTSGGPASAP